MRVIPAAWLLAAIAVCASCGGSGSPSAPSTSSSAPATGGGSACAAIAGSSTSSLIGIFNGTACSATNTAVVLLNLRDKANGALASCSGTVIAPRAVLTAAHCLSSDTALVKVYRGTGVQVNSISFAAFPGYRESDPSGLDVGVVITGEDLGTPVLPLLVSRDANVGEAGVIAGWGLDQNDVGTTLRAGTTTISAVTQAFLQTQFTGSGGSGVCGGDSGGPLLLVQGGTWAVAGVTSSTSLANCSSGTNYFANLRDSDIRSFITSQVSNAVLK